MDELWWFPNDTKNPYVHTLMKHENNTILFDGYFRLEDATMPVRRILFIHREPFLVELTEKKTIKDTSQYGEYDEELGGRICLTPTDLIELKYRLIQHIKTKEEFDLIEKEIIAEEDGVYERNERLIKEREKREYEEIMKTYTYSYTLPVTNNTPLPPDLPHEEFHEGQEPPIQN
jgi:hypothetical protein